MASAKTWSDPEVNFDGLPGPTHNYSGLAEGNLASERHKSLASNPRQAALQGLAKMKALADRGFVQAVLPPHERPDVAALRALGFSGDDAQVLSGAARSAPQLLAACSSAAAMWVANAATVSPSADTADGRVHFTPANLVSHFHRSLEAPTTTRVLRAIFADDRHFTVHDALPSVPQFGDEGAANHTRFSAAAGAPGVSPLGHEAVDHAVELRAVVKALLHQADKVGHRVGGIVFVELDDDVPLAGLQVDLRQFFLERAFVEQETVLRALRDSVGASFTPLVVSEGEVSLQRAVATYLFNSQLLARADGGMVLVAPAECREDAAVSTLLDRLVSAGGPIREVLTFDLRQSMQNGGGPACLRLRIALTAAERKAVPARIWLDERLHAELVAWVAKHYRDRLAPADLADPALLDESRRALDELSRLLRLGSVYPFQRV